MARLLKRDVDRLCVDYTHALARWGETNQATERAWQRWYEARNAYEAQKKSAK